MTNQSLMKDLKTELKTLQKQMKELRSHPEKMMRVQKQVMETNMKYMMQSFKPTLITFLPIIIIFGWFTANLAYEPLLPNQEFTVTAKMVRDAAGNITLTVPEGIVLVSEADQDIFDIPSFWGSKKIATWTLEGVQGTYLLEFEHDEVIQQKEVTIDYTKYAKVEEKYSSGIKSIKLGNNKAHPFNDFSIFGWNPGWFAVYILFSIFFSISLRKLMKIY